jgi:Ca2+-binding RTX toxin-like protein
MKRTKLLLTIVATALAALANARRADAATTVDNPLGSERVAVIVGHTSVGPIVAYQGYDTGKCVVYSLGNGAGLNDDYTIRGSNGDDGVIVFGGFGGSGSGVYCGFTVTALLYNGHFLDIRALSGHDSVLCGAGDSHCHGDGGPDNVVNYSGVGAIFGDSGNDTLTGSSAIATDSLSGGSGDDCLADPGNAHARFDCGTQNVHDFYVSPASGRVSCEVAVSSCF